MGLSELLAYCDERARRHAVNGERANEPEKSIHRARMREAMEIGGYIAEQVRKDD